MKLPFHLRIVELITDATEILIKENETKGKPNIEIGTMMAIVLNRYIHLLRTTLFLPEHVEEVIAKIRRLKASIEDEHFADIYFPDELFDEIREVPNPIEVFLHKHADLCSDDGIKLLSDLEDDVIANASLDPNTVTELLAFVRYHQDTDEELANRILKEIHY